MRARGLIPRPVQVARQLAVRAQDQRVILLEIIAPRPRELHQAAAHAARQRAPGRVFGILMLLPPMDRYLREWEARCKKSSVVVAAPSLPQRVVFLLLAGLMTTVAFAAAFHRPLVELTGLTDNIAVLLMILLPGLYFALGWLNRHRKNGKGPDATRG